MSFDFEEALRSLRKAYQKASSKTADVDSVYDNLNKTLVNQQNQNDQMVFVRDLNEQCCLIEKTLIPQQEIGSEQALKALKDLFLAQKERIKELDYPVKKIKAQLESHARLGKDSSELEARLRSLQYMQEDREQALWYMGNRIITLHHIVDLTGVKSHQTNSWGRTLKDLIAFIAKSIHHLLESPETQSRKKNDWKNAFNEITLFVAGSIQKCPSTSFQIQTNMNVKDRDELPGLQPPKISIKRKSKKGLKPPPLPKRCYRKQTPLKSEAPPPVPARRHVSKKLRHNRTSSR